MKPELVWVDFRADELRCAFRDLPEHPGVTVWLCDRVTVDGRIRWQLWFRGVLFVAVEAPTARFLSKMFPRFR